MLTGWWRDILSMSWEFHTYQSARSIYDMIQRNNTDAIGLSNFRLDPGKPVLLRYLAPAVGNCISAYFLFETKVGRGKGVVNLVAAEDSGHVWKAFTLYTSLQELKWHEERLHQIERPRGVEHGVKSGRKTWLEERIRMQNMDGLEPIVIIVGSGHSGLSLAGRLGMLNIPTLIIEKNECVGDNWRRRYKSYHPLLYSTEPYF